MAFRVQEPSAMERILAVAVVLSSAIAHAETRERPSQPVAVAVNAPTGWGSAKAASVYAQLVERVAIRGNVAVYDYRAGAATMLLLASHGVGLETEYSGRTVDVGLSLQYYSDRTYNGVFVELGGLRRTEDHVEDESSWNSRIEHRVATAYAMRVMVGYSWLISGRVFLAAAVGVSSGRYHGTETTQSTDDVGMPTGAAMTTTLDERKPVGEAYLRLGIAFGR